MRTSPSVSEKSVGELLFPWDKGYDRPVLRPEHRDHLRTSGLLDVNVESAGICSIDKRQAEALGYYPGLTGIRFPYPDTRVVVDRRALPYTRLRVDATRGRNPGQKYENPLKKRLKEGIASEIASRIVSTLRRPSRAVQPMRGHHEHHSELCLARLRPDL